MRDKTSGFPKCHSDVCIAILEKWILADTTADTLYLRTLYPTVQQAWKYYCIARMLARRWCDHERLLLCVVFFFFGSDPSRKDIHRFMATVAYNITKTVPGSR